MIRFFLLCTALLLSCSTAFAYTGKVISVDEGDRLTLLYKGRKVRLSLYGLDAPELRQTHGQEARDFLKSFIKGEVVDVQPIGQMRKSRHTGIVVLGEDNINELMVLNGQAWVDPKTCTEAICATWLKMEEAAKATHKGLWSNPESIPPWDFRKPGKRKKAAVAAPPAHP